MLTFCCHLWSITNVTNGFWSPLQINNPQICKIVRKIIAALYSIESFDELLSKILLLYLQVYSETVIPRLARAAAQVTQLPPDEIMEAFGVTFVSYVARYGYDRYTFHSCIVLPETQKF